MPARVQRTRTKGRPGIPPGARYVGRGTRFGNPWRAADYGREGAARRFADHAEARQIARGYQWHVLSDGRFVCNAEDAEHQAVMDELLPPEPVTQVPGQVAIDGEVEQT